MSKESYDAVQAARAARTEPFPPRNLYECQRRLRAAKAALDVPEMLAARSAQVVRELREVVEEGRP